MNAKVKDARRQPGATRISSKNQVTIPVQALAEAGLEAGDVVWAEVVAPGVVQLVSAESLVRRVAGAHTEVYSEGTGLDELRDEWDR
jgi:bifunctional DNA-binding transcriptional regulator/antitoxin component of YhaV-PrlF toxin-antitoxin module